MSAEDEARQLTRDVAAAHARVIELKNRARRLTAAGSPVWMHLLDAEVKLWDAREDLTRR